MYTMMVKDTSSNKKNNFYLSVPSSDKDFVKASISYEMMTSLSNDIQNMSHIMVKGILEGLYDGRK